MGLLHGNFFTPRWHSIELMQGMTLPSASPYVPSGGPNPEAAKRGRILVVDDDTALLQVNRLVLEDAGFEVLSAHSGEGCRALLAQRLPDLILLDINLPDCDGVELCQSLKAHPSTAGVAILHLSGDRISSEEQAAGLEAGADGYIARPLSNHELVARVEAMLRVKRTEAELRRVTEDLRAASRTIQQLSVLSLDVICVLNEEGEFLEVSAAAEQVFGVPPHTMLGHTLFKWVAPADEGKTRAMFTVVKGGVPTRDFENCCRRRDGSVVHVLWSAVWSPAERRFFCIARDISERKHNEQLLQESHERFFNVVRATNHTVWDWDLVKNQVWWGDGFQNNFGYECGQIDPEARFWYEHIHPEDRERVYGQIKQFVQSGHRVWSDDYRFQRADGTYAHVHDRGYVIHDASGRPIRMVGGMLDETERHEQQARLRESEERFRQFAENVDDAVWIMDATSFRMLFVNAAFQRLRGCAGEETYVRAIDYMASIHPQDRDRVMAAGSRSTIDFNEEYRVIWPDGTIRWVWAHMFPIRDAAGQVYRIGGIARDITERKKAEALIREQAALLDNAQEAIYVEDLEGHVVFWNRSAERIYGRKAVDAVGLSFAPYPEDGGEQHREAKRLVFEKGEWMGELPERTSDGRSLTVEAHWTLVKDADGAPKSILCINTDVTDRKRLEAQFLRAQRMESIGTLAGGIAHDLNNVLAPIIMSIDLLRLQLTGSPVDDTLDTIESSARRGAEMVRQVLSFARGVEGDRLLIQPEHLLKDIQKIVTDTFPKNITFRMNLQHGDSAVLGDPTQLHQVLLNLCVNARDAMPNGGRLAVRTENLHVDSSYAAMNIEAKEGPYLMIEVQDGGQGIPTSIVEKIFDPFFTTKEPGKGTGLGLSTSLAIVKSHGGFMRVDSEFGKGSTFRLYLPAQGVSEMAASEPCAQCLPRGAGQMIMVIDDEESIRTVTQRTLEAFGYRVMLATDGAEAVALYAQNRHEIEAVITDIMMPVMDGPATINVLQKINPDVRIIAASGMCGEAQMNRMLNAGIKHFLPKPYTAEAMLQTLAEILGFDGYHEPVSVNRLLPGSKNFLF